MGGVSWFVVFGLVAVLWALQMFLAQRQAAAFMTTVRRMRVDGATTAIGASSTSRLHRRTYVALAARDGVVVDAVRLSGVTVAARPRPVPSLRGRELVDLAAEGDAGDPLDRAAAMAAEALLRPRGARDGAAEDVEEVSSAG